MKHWKYITVRCRANYLYCSLWPDFNRKHTHNYD